MNYIDKKVKEVLQKYNCKTRKEAIAKLDQELAALQSRSQMHLTAFDKNKEMSEIQRISEHDQEA